MGTVSESASFTPPPPPRACLLSSLSRRSFCAPSSRTSRCPSAPTTCDSRPFYSSLLFLQLACVQTFLAQSAVHPFDATRCQIILDKMNALADMCVTQWLVKDVAFESIRCSPASPFNHPPPPPPPPHT
jgi:hypothetical protein